MTVRRALAIRALGHRGRSRAPRPVRGGALLRPFFCLFYLLSTAFALQPPSSHVAFSALEHPFDGCRGERVGEADNPGPDVELMIGTSNPCGLRGKEALALEFGPALWSFSETQLSAITCKASRHSLIHKAKAQDRHVRVHAGAAVPLRSNSTWAGAWSGVLQFGDFPSKTLQLAWS